MKSLEIESLEQLLEDIKAKRTRHALKGEFIVMQDIPEFNILKKSSAVVQGTIVSQVEQLKTDGHSSGYHFTVINTGEQHHTNYYWILARNTPENLQRIAHAATLEKKAKISKNEYEMALRKIETLPIN